MRIYCSNGGAVMNSTMQFSLVCGSSAKPEDFTWWTIWLNSRVLPFWSICLIKSAGSWQMTLFHGSHLRRCNLKFSLLINLPQSLQWIDLKKCLRVRLLTWYWNASWSGPSCFPLRWTPFGKLCNYNRAFSCEFMSGPSSLLIHRISCRS